MSDQNVTSYLMMDFTTFYSVSVPVCVTSLLLNLFSVFCMVFPKQETERLKQPLTVLLGTFVGCNITLQVCIFLIIILKFYSSSRNIGFAVTVEMTYFAMRTSVSSSLWLNVFYYCQIVPTQRSVFICLKRNIRCFIYSALIIDKIFFLFSFAVGVSYRAVFDNDNTTYTGSNETLEEWHKMVAIFKTELWGRSGYSLLCLCVMLASSCATLLYLQRHMKSMEGSTSSSNSTLQRQMRVTITGIVQTVLFFLCSVWLILSDVLYYEFRVNIDPTGYFSCTVLCVYSFGATINLCVGQSIFRQWVFVIWQKWAQIFTFLSK